MRKVWTSQFVYDENEINAVMEVMKSGWITQGKYTKQFEEDFARFVGTKYAIAVNSGSSANLVALCALNEIRSLKYKYIITTPATFSTTIFPIIQIGAVPVFVDVEPDTLCIDPNMVEEAVYRFDKYAGGTVGALFPVDLLGHSCDMIRLTEIASRYNLFMVEDCCEAHGAECKGKRVGSFPDCGTFSFFASHHISIGEGGMITTDDDRIAENAQSIRAFGRVTKVAADPSKKVADRYEVIDKNLGLFDMRMTFDRIGYNMKITDLQSSIGVEQLKKLPMFLEKRRANAEYIVNHLEPYSDFLQLPIEKKGTKHAWHHVGILVRIDAPFTRHDIVTHLENNGVETRTIEAGNMARQPCMRKARYEVYGELKNCDKIWKDGFMVGCHQGLVKDDLIYMVDVLAQFLEGHKK